MGSKPYIHKILPGLHRAMVILFYFWNDWTAHRWNKFNFQNLHFWINSWLTCPVSVKLSMTNLQIANKPRHKSYANFNTPSSFHSIQRERSRYRDLFLEDKTYETLTKQLSKYKLAYELSTKRNLSSPLSYIPYFRNMIWKTCFLVIFTIP